MSLLTDIVEINKGDVLFETKAYAGLLDNYLCIQIVKTKNGVRIKKEIPGTGVLLTMDDPVKIVSHSSSGLTLSVWHLSRTHQFFLKNGQDINIEEVFNKLKELGVPEIES